MATRTARRTQPERAPTSGLLLISVCFFLSGATALMYEVVWLRMLGLVFGHTVYALTTVLAAFMAGLGLGSILVGRRAAGFRDPIRAYGVLEIGIGLSCALTPALLWLASLAYLGLYRPLLGISYGLFGFVQFLLVFALLLIPTTLMGGTLPVLSQALARAEGIGRTVGMLYGVNTFGAVAGVILAGYGLLPALGNRTTLAVAVVANLAVGVAAIVYSRTRRAAIEAPRPARRPPAPSRAPAAAPGPPDLAARLILIALGVSGAVSMIYEVAWTRALVLVIGASTYAFTAMLVAFLLGIAGGAAVYSWLWGTRRASAGSFAMIQVGIGLATAFVLPVFERLPHSVVLAVKESASPGSVGLMQLLISAQALLPSTLLIGATFPCAVAAAVRAPGRVGLDVGRLYASNTLGAIVGTVLAGFVVVPALGVHASIKLGIVINLLLAAGLSVVPLSPAKIWRWGAAGAALAIAAAVVVIPPWDPVLMSSGPAIYAQRYAQPRRSLADMMRATRLLFYRDGLSATVSVVRIGDTVMLRVNGKIDASTSASDMPTQLLSGHLPLLLHRDPRTVLVIGHGSGITAGAMTRHPVERLDIVEIEPAVVEASRFFARENRDVLNDPRVRLSIGDGRNFLLTTPDRYDVIAAEPSNPWLGGVASLFTVEFFELARRHLRPGGIMLQWIQGYNLLPDDLQMVIKTFRTAFPATSVWEGSAGDFFLLGRAEPAPVDLDLLRARYEANPALERDLTGISITGWAGVLAYFMLGEEGVARYSDGAPLNTDDRLRLEFSAPRALYVDTFPANRERMRRFRAADLPEVTPETRRLLEREEVRLWIGQSLRARGAHADAARFVPPPTPATPGALPTVPAR